MRSLASLGMNDLATTPCIFEWGQDHAGHADRGASRAGVRASRQAGTRIRKIITAARKEGLHHHEGGMRDALLACAAMMKDSTGVIPLTDDEGHRADAIYLGPGSGGEKTLIFDYGRGTSYIGTIYEWWGK